MKTTFKNIAGTAALLTAMAINPAGNLFAQEPENANKTLSPYFFVKSDDPSVDQLPLKSTRADVTIAGVIADVKVTQEYQNTGKKPLEAIYIFPASTRAAVYGMKMIIGERTITAEIREKEQARQDYENAIKEGKTASLLEQQRPNVFQMNVGNILPGDIIKVELSYTELLIPTDGVYQFVYPSVVGPRYSNRNESEVPASEKWVANPYTEQGVLPASIFDIHLNIAAGMPISDVKCSSHDVNISYSGTSEAVVSLKNANGHEGNRDFVLDYRLTGSAIQSGLLLYQGKDENYFLAMIQPPARITSQVVPPRDYVFIMDVSGSMYGFPIEVSKTLLKDLIKNLKPTDRFNVILFAGASSVLSNESLPATADNLNKALEFIDKQQGGGGTELLPALKMALSLKGTENYARTFVIATDGYVEIEKQAFELIKNNLSKASFFAFGIGSSVNRYLIEGMAHAGQGEPFIALNEDEAKQKAAQFRKYIEYPVLSHIKVNFEGFNVYDVEPMDVPDVFAERPVLIMGKWTGNPGGKIVLKGLSAEKNFVTELNVSQAIPSGKNSALRYLWARERIRNLDDLGKAGYEDDVKKQVLALGLKYNLLTNYTSFVAIDSKVRNEGGKPVTVNQPLPLPEAVSNYAVGGTQMNAFSGKVSGVSRKYALAPVAKEETLSLNDSSEEEPSFVTAETQPEFNGGMKALREFIKKNIRYPEELKNSGISGKVVLSFFVYEDGTIKDIKVIRSLNEKLDAEAIRVLNLTSGMWKPGMQNGKVVRCMMTIPVEFK